MRALFIVILILVDYCANAQSGAVKEFKYNIDKLTANQNKVLFNKEIIKFTIIGDVLSLKNADGILLGSFPLTSLGKKDSATKEVTLLSNKSILFKNNSYESASKINISNGRLDSLTLSINNQFVFAIDGARGWHCINRNHNPVHTCSTLPSLASPPCGKPDCIWQQDQ